MITGPNAPDAAQDPLSVRATRSSLWSVSGQALQTLLGLAGFALLARHLTPEAYGLVGMAATVQGILGVLGDSGMTAAVVRAPVVDERVEATAFWVALGGATLLSLASAAAAPLLGLLYGDPAVVPLAFALSATFLVAAPARVSTGKLTRRLAFRTLTAVNVGASTGALALAWWLARAGLGAWALVAQMVLTFALQTVLTLACEPVRVGTSLVSRRAASELARFGSQLSGFSLTNTVARMGESVLGGRYLGAEAVGLMSMGTKLVVVPMHRITAAVSGVLLPTIARLEPSRQGDAFRAALRLTSLGTIPISLGLCAIAPEIVSLLPDRWANLTVPLLVYALGSLIEPLAWHAMAGATARGRSEALLRVGLALVPVGWAGAALGAASGRVEIMVGVSVTVTSIGALLILRIVWRDFALQAAHITSLVRPHLVGVAMAIVVRASLWATGLSDRPAGAALGVVVGGVTYVALAGTVLREDCERLRSLVLRALAVRRVPS